VKLFQVSQRLSNVCVVNIGGPPLCERGILNLMVRSSGVVRCTYLSILTNTFLHASILSASSLPVCTGLVPVSCDLEARFPKEVKIDTNASLVAGEMEASADDTGVFERWECLARGMYEWRCAARVRVRVSKDFWR